MSGTIRDVVVFSESSFIISGGDDGHGAILKTSDGGISWQVATNSFDNQINCMYFLNSDTGFCADSDIIIYKTTNGGQDWSGFYGTEWPLTVNRNLRDIAFTNDSTGFVCGGKNLGNGVLYNTANAGNYWSFSEFAHEYRGICFRDAQNGVMCGYGSLLGTNDGGQTFKTIYDAKEFYTGICLDSQNNYWMCAFNGSVFKSISAGQTWEKVRDGSTWNAGAAQQNCIAISQTGRIAIAGPNGFLTWSNDNGNSWNDRESFGGNEILKLEWLNESSLLAVGKNGAYVVILK